MAKFSILSKINFLSLSLLIKPSSTKQHGISGDSNIYFKGLVLNKYEYSKIAEQVRQHIRSKMESKTKTKTEKGELLQFLPFEKQTIINTIS